MNRWSLKVKVGAYAAGLTMLALIAAAAVLLKAVQYYQIAELDRQLEAEVQELFRDLKNFREAPLSAEHQLREIFIPHVLRRRFVMVEGSGGQIIYLSPGLAGEELPELPAGRLHTVAVQGQDCRGGTFREGRYTAHVAYPLAEIEQFQGDLLRGLLLALPAAGVVVFFGGLWLGRKAVAPVAAITSAAEQISAERLGDRLPLPAARDEIFRLTQVLNGAFERLQNSYEAAIRFSADASHQLKTPVAVLRAARIVPGAGCAPGIARARGDRRPAPADALPHRPDRKPAPPRCPSRRRAPPSNRGRSIRRPSPGVPADDIEALFLAEAKSMSSATCPRA
ncbi:MAG: HAMP domain-containing protein [Verrucomicrobiales bacterium]